VDIEVTGYRLDGRIGSAASLPGEPTPGGAAVVHRGVRLADGMSVAVKVFHPAAADRAHREAELAGAVEHPHLVPILEVVTGPQAVALISPLAAGGNLGDLLAARLRLRWPEVLTVLIPLADALAAAHERDVVHGDVSAGNVLFDAAGRPLLADLGAARAVAEVGGPVATTPTDTAPEIARGAEPAPAADLFSLGSVALHCLSGQPAWPAQDLQDVLIQSTAGQWPDPDDLLAPASLLAVVRRLLEAEPERRGSAAQAAVELRGVGEPEPVELMAPAPGGGMAPPAPATVVRPDAVRPPREVGHRSKSRVPKGRRSRAAGRRPSGPAGRHRRSGWGDRVAVLFGARPWRRRRPARRGQADPGALRPAHDPDAVSEGRHRRWRAVAALAVLVLLLAGAVRVGLWWSGADRTDPTSASTLPGAAPGPGATARPAPPTGVPPDVPSDARAASSAPPAAVDWKGVVTALDAARATALTARDPALLDEVYTAGAGARAVDVRRIAAMRDAGYHVTAAGHRVGDVTLVHRGADGTVTVRVTEAMPAYPVLDDDGATVGSTQAGHSVVTMDLRSTPAGFRIAAIDPG
jgi:hypothetical protein